MRLFFLFIMLISFLSARENPFFAAKGEKDMDFTSNQKENILPLKQVSMTLPDQARVIKAITVKYQNLDGSFGTKTIQLQNKIDWHLPLFISQNYDSDETTQAKIKKPIFQKITTMKYATFFIANKTLKVKTKNKLLRNFLLVHPHRIILDFSKKSDVKNKTQIVKNSVFQKIQIGNHTNYFRAVITLDGYYKYHLEKKDDAIIIKLQ